MRRQQLLFCACLLRDSAAVASISGRRLLENTLDLLGSINPLYTTSGLVIGFIVGLTGVGGGSLMTPILVLLFGVHPATAVGTDLLFAGVTKAVGTAVHGRNGAVSWRIVGLLAGGSVPASAATLLVLNALGPRTHATSALISFVLGFALVATAASILLRGRLITLTQNADALPPARQALLTVVTGAAIGVLAHAVPLTLIAGTGYWTLGVVNWSMLASLLVGSIPGIIAGSASAPRIPDRVLRPILAVVLALVGAKLVLSY